MAPQRDNFYLSSVFLVGSLLSWSAMAFKSEVQRETCCKKFLAMRWRKNAFGQFLPNYRTLSHCDRPQSALVVVHKKIGDICLNLDLLWVKDLKDYIDKARQSAGLPTAGKQLSNTRPAPQRHTTTEAHPRSLHSTRPTETIPGSTETWTWILLDRQPVTATFDQTPDDKLLTSVVETSLGTFLAFPGSTHSSEMAGWNSRSEVPHASSSVPLTSPSLATGASGKVASVIFPTIPERHTGQLNQKMVLISLISIVVILSLLSFAIYKRCKRSTSKGFNHHPTQTSSYEMGVPKLSQLA